MSDIGKSYTSFLRNASDLYAFLVVCRFGRIGQAAQELRISQPSLSQRIRNLEEVVGRPLFVRVARGVELTEAGRVLHKDLEGPFSDAARHFDAFLNKDSRRTVSISVDYAFSHGVLIPGMAHIRQDVGSDVDIRVIASQEPLKGEGPEADITIFMCDKAFAPENAKLLFREEVSAVCSLDFAKKHPEICTPADLVSDPSLLLHLRTPGHPVSWCTWDEWLTDCGGLKAPLRRFTEYNSHELVMRSVLDGEGVALAWHGLSDDLLRRGWIVPLFRKRIMTGRGYFICLNNSAPAAVVQRVFDAIVSMT